MKRIPWLGSNDPFPGLERFASKGVVAYGGNLSPERLLNAYSNGLFPWYNPDEPIAWWSPDPRFVLPVDGVYVSRSMRKVLRSGEFEITADTVFTEVMAECASVPRPGQDGTWINNDIVTAYTALHNQGYAHSIEAWHDGELCGGLYGMALGNMFFGESMFARRSNASKAAFISLSNFLKKHDFLLIDCQVYTDHLASLGAGSIHRSLFYDILRHCLAQQGLYGPWTNLFAEEQNLCSF